MSRETLQGLEERPDAFLDRQEQRGDDRQSLAARLVSVERAYEAVVARLRGYERERREIRLRLERLFARLDRLDAPRRQP
jgi:hypothetical protein